MAEPAILHRCPNCGGYFDSPSVCEDGAKTVETPVLVPRQKLAELVHPHRFVGPHDPPCDCPKCKRTSEEEGQPHAQ